jgi:hypothetical protein
VVVAPRAPIETRAAAAVVRRVLVNMEVILVERVERLLPVSCDRCIDRMRRF